MFSLRAELDGAFQWETTGHIEKQQTEDIVECNYVGCARSGYTPSYQWDSGRGFYYTISDRANLGSKLIITQTEYDDTERPELGVMPRKLFEEQRMVDICGGISRYAAKGQLIPKVWIDEMYELVDNQQYYDKEDKS